LGVVDNAQPVRQKKAPSKRNSAERVETRYTGVKIMYTSRGKGKAGSDWPGKRSDAEWGGEKFRSQAQGRWGKRSWGLRKKDSPRGVEKKGGPLDPKPGLGEGWGSRGSGNQGGTIWWGSR